MARPSTRPTGAPDLRLPAPAVAEMRARLPAVAEHAVTAIIEEVPSYTDAFSGPMGAKITTAVQLALSGFLSLASGKRAGDQRTPAAPSVEGAYQLGRGEARSGRSTDAILAAYRIGARVCWREMSTTAVEAGMDGQTLAGFAELVFAYIDELSAASVAGHDDESATSGRVRRQLRERLAQRLLDGSPAEAVLEAADKAGWEPPATLTAVLVPAAQVRPVLGAITPATLQAVDLPGLEEDVLLLVPDAHGRRRVALLRAVRERGAVVGPARPWEQVRASYDRARRARFLALGEDTEAHLPQLVLTADADALHDLRDRALAPLAELRPAAAEKLADTLRAWLLHLGRRDEVAAALFVHPQTVRYRMGQLRELYGDRLDDPDTVLDLILALGKPVPSASPSAPNEE